MVFGDFHVFFIWQIDSRILFKCQNKSIKLLVKAFSAKQLTLADLFQRFLYQFKALIFGHIFTLEQHVYSSANGHKLQLILFLLELLCLLDGHLGSIVVGFVFLRDQRLDGAILQNLFDSLVSFLLIII